MNNVFDLHNKIALLLALASAAIASDTTTDGVIIDTAGFTGLEFILTSGVITDGAYAVSMQHGDDSGLSDAADVPVADVLGAGLADFALADDNVVKKIGYIGGKRYVRLKIVSTAVTTGGIFSAVAAKFGAAHQPVA